MKKVFKSCISAAIISAILLGSFAGCKKEETNAANSETAADSAAVSSTEAVVTGEQITSEESTKEKSEETVTSTKPSSKKSTNTTKPAKSDKGTKATKSSATTKATQATASASGKQAPNIKKNEVKYVKNSRGEVTGLEIKIWGSYSKFNSIIELFEEKVDYSIYFDIDGGLTSDDNYQYYCYLKNGNIIIDHYRYIETESHGNLSMSEPEVYQSELVVDSCSYKLTSDYAFIKIDLHTPISLKDYLINFTVGKGVFETADGKLNEEFEFPD